MRSRTLLFQSDSIYTRLRKALDDGAIQVGEFFLELKQERDDPDRDDLLERVKALLPLSPGGARPFMVPHRFAPRSELSQASVSSFPRAPRIVALTDGEIRCGPGADVPGRPDFAGSAGSGSLPDASFWVRAGALPPCRQAVVSIVSAGLIRALRDQPLDGGLPAAQVAESFSGLDDVALADLAFSDVMLKHWNVARLLSSAPTLVTSIDASGSLYVEVSLPERGMPPLPAGTLVVVATQ